MQQQSIYRLQRALDNVLVSPVYRIASLKRHHPPPTFLFERIAGLLRVETIGRKRRMSRSIQQAYWSAQQPLPLLKKCTHTWMRVVGCQVNTLSFALFVVTISLP